MIQARYTHTNIIAQDWKRLARFYQDVFGCVPVLPERNLSGAWLEDATHVPDAALQGMHLRLPGHGPQGPTLEIFGYNAYVDRPEPATNRPGFAHLAFVVEDVAAARAAVLAAGGMDHGALVETDVPGAGHLTFIYARDPEGNILELQHWS